VLFSSSPPPSFALSSPPPSKFSVTAFDERASLALRGVHNPATQKEIGYPSLQPLYYRSDLCLPSSAR
jgi:hypothetical protein